MTKQKPLSVDDPADARGWLRIGLRRSLFLFDRLIAADIALFAAAMVFKLYWFSTLLSIQYMDMTRTDANIETGAVLLISFWALLLPTRGRIVALIALNTGLSFMLYADVIYYRYFQDLISIPVLLQLSQLESLGGSIDALLRTYDLWLFADLLFAIPYALYVIWRGGIHLRVSAASRPLQAPRWRMPTTRIGLSFAVGALGFALFFNNVSHAADTWAKGLFEKNWWNLSIYNVIGGIGFHGYDLYNYARLNWFDAEPVSAEQKSEALLKLGARGNARGELEGDPLFGAYKGSNVLLIQVEALQSFVLGQSIGGQEITPVMNGLMKESAYFPRFHHQTAQGRTSDADFAANCSLYPVKSGSVFIQYASHNFTCMPERLKNNGYAVNVFHPYQGGFWNRNVMYDRMAYDQFYSLKHFQLDEPMGWSIGDKSFYRQSIDVIANMRQPFHAFFITLSSHHPYKLPAAAKKLDTEELEGTIMGDYLQAIHYADSALGELIERMKAENLWSSTIVALFGDHDNSIQQWELYKRFMANPDSRLEQEQTSKGVPLLIHLPDGAHAGARDIAGGQIDIAPTILHLLGVSMRAEGMLGMPLLTDERAGSRLVVQRNGSWTDGTLYYMPSEDGLPANGKCYKASSGELLNAASCLDRTEEAQGELILSDRVVVGDLLRAIKPGGAFEALGADANGASPPR